MSFFSILFALLIEQARPLKDENFLHTQVRNALSWTVRQLDTGQASHARLTWVVVILVPAVLIALVHWALLIWLGWIAAVIWNVAILYLTLGFRQFSHHFTDIRDALDAGDEDAARGLLAQWMQIDASDLPRSEIVRQVIAHSVLNAHRCVFGVFAWYSLLSGLGLGPAGAVMYRMAEYFSALAKRPASPHALLLSPALRDYVAVWWHRVDWIPARLTAMGFAFVGSFEDAIDRWRKFEAAVPGDNDGIVLAATAGAVHIGLTEVDLQNAAPAPRLGHLRAIVGLVWRTVVMWMVVLVLLSLARLLG
jgi:adenosylcobinamide-phosphate synthase